MFNICYQFDFKMVYGSISVEVSYFTEYNASCKVKEQKDGFETISHDFRNNLDK